MQRLKLTVTALALTLTGSLALAVPPGPPPGPPMEEIAAELGLDAQQEDALERIFDEHHAQMVEERKLLEASGQRPSRDELRVTHQQAREDLEAQLSTVLTLEQLDAFRKLMDERRPRRGPDSSEQRTEASSRAGADAG